MYAVAVDEDRRQDLWCVVLCDVRRTSIRLVLFVYWGDKVPVRLESKLLCSRNSSRVLDVLEAWTHWYLLDADPQRIIVGCRANAWPRRLCPRLQQAGYTVQWIDDDQPLKEGVAFLDSLQENPLFLRATLMAHWPSARGTHSTDGMVLQVQYDILRQRLMDLEKSLFAEGRLRCPGHLLPSCPDCEFQEPLTAGPSWGVEAPETDTGDC